MQNQLLELLVNRVLAREQLKGGSTDHLPHINFRKTILYIYYTHLPKYIHFCKAGRKEGGIKKKEGG